MKQSFKKRRAVIDPRFPWKLARPIWRPLPYAFTTSISEWQALLKRAERGDSVAEWEVAGRYEDGSKDRAGKILVRRSARKAMEWLRRAAEHGCGPAQNTLGVLLGDENLPPKNRRQALAWLKKAFRAGDNIAASNIAITYRENGDLRSAVRWFEKSVAGGDDDARIQLGIHYYWGKGVKRDPVAAVRCFRRATKGNNICEAGRDDAYFYLGIAYLEGKGVKTSIPTAKKLFQRANVDNDHPPARRALRELA